MKPIVLLLAALAFAAPLRAEAPSSGTWSFRVLLDGKPIGRHAFTLKALDGDRRELRSVASFDVKLLGITVYSYRHEAVEQWQGNCLAALDATTEDGGKDLAVQARREGAALAVSSPQGRESIEGCVMSFAYWHPAMRAQSRLLNAQTGKHEAVKIEALPDGPVDVEGRTVQAKRWRITGPEQPVDLAYGPDGDWIGLDSKVSGGKRVLSYRRE